MSKLEYQIIEDNAGGLHAFVWHAGKIRWGCGNLEYLSHADFEDTLTVIEQPQTTLRELQRWDSLYTDPQGVYDMLTTDAFGWRSIAVYGNGVRVQHTDRMGAAGKRAFGVD